MKFMAVSAVALALTGYGVLVQPGIAAAHCDSLDGPVASEAAAALEAGDPAALLKWVGPGHEGEITAAFEHALAVRALGPEARELADTYFLETLIRIHRAGEGAPYTGLKPAGSIEPAVAAADQALAAGSVDALAEGIGHAAEQAVRQRFALLVQAAQGKEESTEAGREYVEAYVSYVHFVENLHNLVAGEAAAHADHAAH